MAKLTHIDGRPVIDAKHPLKLHITAADVSRSNVKKPDSCVIAQTCLRKKGVKEVRIHLSRAYLRSNDHNWQRFIVPGALRSEIVSFDRGGRFAPGEYTLHKVQPSKKLGKMQPGGVSGTKRSKKRRKPHVLTDVRSGPA